VLIVASASVSGLFIFDRVSITFGVSSLRHKGTLVFLLRPVGVNFAANVLYTSWFSNLLVLSIPDECYSRNAT